MDKSSGTGVNGSGTAQRGLWRLMLKLPAMRGRLQILAATSPSITDLFEAYEEASLTLERMSKDRPRSQCPLREEYETVCAEIESDVIHYVLGHPSGVSD
ncbi:hypothetical protein [Rhizobium sp. BE258]|jgi:hypothetical protein|uniref:hypothetical protein n=1 Tax=Rhizobium sp. BE258 TaxID=2817722 RepID=UPI000DDABB08|nr:hypothetical protein [Rhizobium sp. BE258]MDR7147956.1 hypothetical protein [Rhizobium sp. BE258]